MDKVLNASNSNSNRLNENLQLLTLNSAREKWLIKMTYTNKNDIHTHRYIYIYTLLNNNMAGGAIVVGRNAHLNWKPIKFSNVS
jgi:hypothetical protein